MEDARSESGDASFDSHAPPPSPGGYVEYLEKIRRKPEAVLPVDVEAENYGKIFNDSVHGHIHMHPLLMKIIDTEEFQRLRELKQLGMSYYVYPGASHRRYEHSIGVSHLAGLFVQALAKRQPELGISRSEILCVMIAGLVHDLGHGPFSHTWERFMEEANPQANWKHEQTSLDMFEMLLEKNGLRPVLASAGIGEQDIKFIKEQIYGPLDGALQFEARPPTKRFLYDIVANKPSGVDVDKWDYLARDCRQVNMKDSFDHHRFIKCSRVLLCPDNEVRITFRDKEIENVYDMFRVRLQMHKRVYQHRVTRVLDAMIVEAMIKADEFIRFRDDDGNGYKPSEAYQNMSAFSRMDDGSIVAMIKNDPNPRLKPARDLLKRIAERRLYACIGRTEPREKFDQSDEMIVGDMVSKITPKVDAISPELFASNVLVIRNKYDYGKGKENPLENVRFFSKCSPNDPKYISSREVSEMLPKNFHEMEIFIFYRSEDPAQQKEASVIVERWAKSTGYGLKNASVNLSTMKRKPEMDENAEKSRSDQLDHARRKISY